jgi:hypothetical protein
MEYLDLELAWFCVEDSLQLWNYTRSGYSVGLVMDNKDLMDNCICTAAVAIMLNTRFQRRMRNGES